VFRSYLRRYVISKQPRKSSRMYTHLCQMYMATYCHIWEANSCFLWELFVRIQRYLSLIFICNSPKIFSRITKRSLFLPQRRFPHEMMNVLYRYQSSILSRAVLSPCVWFPSEININIFIWEIGIQNTQQGTIHSVSYGIQVERKHAHMRFVEIQTMFPDGN
jgi:hypothetical protein